LREAHGFSRGTGIEESLADCGGGGVIFVDMTANDLELLRQFAHEASQEAFTTLVNRHLGLVYSAALRQVRSPQLAQEVSQSVFTNLARNAAKLRPDTILTAWLYRVTRHTAIDVVRREARRQAREQISLQMSEMNDPAADWTHIEPLLDEAMESLEEADRTAILLRYFENKSLREVGQALGASEDAAQKRVNRAVERLREFFSKRRVTLGVGGLAALVSANAIQAAPGALAGTIAVGAMLAARTLSTSSAVITTKTIAIAMTTTQKALIALFITGAVAAGFYQLRQSARLREQAQALQQEHAQLDDLTRQRDSAKAEAARIRAENDALKKRPSEVVKLRGEVGKLRGVNEAMGSKSALSKVTANPEARKLLHDQQKLGMSLIYKAFAQQAKLAPDQTEKLNELLADQVMENVDAITTVLRDKPAMAQMDQIFAAQQAALDAKVADLLGADGAAQFADYNKNLLSSLTSQQFSDQLNGTDAEKAAKTQQLTQVIQEAEAAALSSANLPANYQAVPMLNFENIASEQQAAQSITLLDNIFQGVTARGSSFLSADELTKFQQFAATAVANNQAALTMNRTLMAPLGN
jgi:RNA polymerase sigma factor (sigma-70 family)